MQASRPRRNRCRPHGNIEGATPSKHLYTFKFMLQCSINSRGNDSRLSPPHTRIFSLLYSALNFRCKTVHGHFYIRHTNIFLTTLIIFELIDVRLRYEFQRYVCSWSRDWWRHYTKFVMSIFLYGKCYFHVVFHAGFKVIWQLKFFQMQRVLGRFLLFNNYSPR